MTPPNFTLIFEPLSFWKQYYAARGLQVPSGIAGSNPTLLLHSVKFAAMNVTQSPPPHVDWRQRGFVPPVISEGEAPSAAVSGVELTEMLWTIHSGQRVSLSLAEAADCCDNLGIGLQCILKLGGLCSTADYPKRQQHCGSDSCKAAVNLAGWKQIVVKAGSITALQVALQDGPVAALVEADNSVFEMYSGGVITSPLCGQKLDHSVTIVGYNATAQPPYWIVRNTWGPAWGDKGYVKIGMLPSNPCGLLSSVGTLSPP